MIPKRPLEFELIPFAGGDIERVTVMAENRAIGFSRAASQSADPNSVWKVRIVRDNGRYLDRNDTDAHQLPLEHCTPSIRWHPDYMPYRAYIVYFDLFGRVQADEGAGVSGRINVFTAGAMLSDTPDNIWQVWLYAVASKPGDKFDFYFIDENKRYGGVTVDLTDPLDEWVATSDSNMLVPAR